MALARILQDEVKTRCKDELALGETHTYNPPHRKWCRFGHGRRLLKWLAFPDARRHGMCPPVLSKTWVGLAWVYLGAVAVFPEKSKERFE